MGAFVDVYLIWWYGYEQDTKYRVLME